MRVLISSDNSAGPFYVRSAWAKVLTAIGHQVFFWDIRTKPAFDAFNESNPEIFIGQTYNVDKAVFKCLVNRPQLKVALYGSAWGDLVDNLDREKYPIVYVTETERRTMELLKNAVGKPDFVFIHVSDRFLEGTMGGWRKIGIRPEGILNAADTFSYLGGKYSEDVACQAGYVGGYWPYKARNINPYLLPLCHPNSKIGVKIWGNGQWPTHRYLGTLDESRAKDVFVSATVCPNISESHSTELGWDCVERPFKVLLAGGFCVSDYVEEMQKEVFPNGEIPAGRTPKEYQELVRHFIAHPEERLPYMKGGRDAVLEGHTYFHRVGTILSSLGLKDESERCLKVYNEKYRTN